MLFLALALPLIHAAAYAMGWLDEPSRPARELLIVCWLLLLGGAALLQHRLLERSKREIETARDRLSGEIEWHEAAQAERDGLIAELESKNAELERFTYTVSHDLKSPLVTIQGYLGVLDQANSDGDGERLASSFGRIRSAAAKMTRLLDELLELSRLGRPVNEPEEVSLTELARKAIDLVGPELGERPVRIDLAPDLPVVTGDRLRLLEVFQNLIGNAVKFMGAQLSRPPSPRAVPTAGRPTSSGSVPPPGGWPGCSTSSSSYRGSAASPASPKRST